MDGLLLIAKKSRNILREKILANDESPYEAVGVRKNGSEYQLRLEARMIPYRDKNIRVVEFRDITVQKQMEREQEQLQTQLTQAQKMEAIGTLAGGIAYGFNNMLSAMLGYSELAKEQLPQNDKIREDLDQVIKAGYRAADLVKQILTFSRQGAKAKQPLKVQLIIKEVLKLLRASLPTTIQIQENIDGDCTTILADPTQIHQVIMNLCTNAKHAIGNEFGILSVSLSEKEVSSTATITECPLITSGNNLDLEINDTGCGMDDLIRSKIFDPFFTTKEKGKGTGLGLAVVHGIIEHHNGAITVTSKPKQGTTFHIYLPVISEEGTHAEHNVIGDIPRGDGERVLIVDAENSIAILMQRILDNLGYAVTSFIVALKHLMHIKRIQVSLI